jgi:hypothetical protein
MNSVANIDTMHLTFNLPPTDDTIVLT